MGCRTRYQNTICHQKMTSLCHTKIYLSLKKPFKPPYYYNYLFLLFKTIQITNFKTSTIAKYTISIIL